ncbi:Mycothiol acetyltransferase [Planctomycetes bacterium Pan216]|uniref:Mycothiol acetyltransferase n=1 Tax=Kolteria novifilia TaxID=2527975 RepID=A0A518AXE9_9BACT|nr:Mycothiol acetyltransferase [Planctomycetes bacterium Pan216]
MGSSVVVERCPREDWSLALSCLYTHLPPRDQMRQVESVLQSEAHGRVRLDGIVWCHRKRKPIAIAIAFETPGRSLLVWPPRFREAPPPGTAHGIQRDLFVAAVDYARSREVRMAQLLLSNQQQHLVASSQEAGFVHLTRLIYLRRSVFEPPIDEPGQVFEVDSYGPENHEDLLHILERSYRGSRDCPELNGARDLEDIVESHQAQGLFEPKYWKLIKQEGEWVGCILLVRLRELDAFELAYIGIVPEARGRGLGRELTRQALRETREAGVSLLTLACDERNWPARAMYDAEGFVPWDEKDAYLVMINPADGRLKRTVDPEIFTRPDK